MLEGQRPFGSWSDGKLTEKVDTAVEGEPGKLSKHAHARPHFLSPSMCLGRQRSEAMTEESPPKKPSTGEIILMDSKEVIIQGPGPLDVTGFARGRAHVTPARLAFNDDAQSDRRYDSCIYRQFSTIAAPVTASSTGLPGDDCASASANLADIALMVCRGVSSLA